VPEAEILFCGYVVNGGRLGADLSVTSAPARFRGFVATGGELNLGWNWEGNAVNFGANCRREYLWKSWVGENW
jgi:hypothetical protein